MGVAGVMASSDGVWRVEVMDDGRYRVLQHGALVAEARSVAQVQAALDELGGPDLADLRET